MSFDGTLEHNMIVEALEKVDHMEKDDYDHPWYPMPSSSRMMQDIRKVLVAEKVTWEPYL